MARPTKTGLDYYPLDVDIEIDEKIEFIEAEAAAQFGHDKSTLAFGIIIKIMNRIYREGCFCEWTDRQQKLFCRKANVDINLLNVVINTAIECGLFHKKSFNDYNVLTSSGIQARYLEAVKRRHSVEMPEEILLIDINSHINTVIVDINSINSNIGTQSKVKESKVKESKVKKEKKCFYDCVLLAQDEIDKLETEFNGQTQSKIKALNDYIMSTGKTYESHYHTILNWERMNNGKQGGIFDKGRNGKTIPFTGAAGSDSKDYPVDCC